MSFNYLQQKRKSDIIFTNSIGQTTILNTAQLTKENCLRIKNCWALESYQQFNIFAQRCGIILKVDYKCDSTGAKCHIEVKNQFIHNFNSFKVESCARNKKESRKQCISQIIDLLIENNFFQEHISKDEVDRVLNDPNAEDNIFHSFEKSRQNQQKQFNEEYNTENKSNNSKSSSGFNNNYNNNLNNIKKEGKNFFKRANETEDLNIKQLVQTIKNVNEETEENCLSALKKLLVVLKSHISWDDVSILWFYALNKGKIELLKKILKIIFSDDNTDFINKQIKEEMIFSFIFLIPKINNWNELNELIDAYFAKINYFNEDIPFTKYYSNFRKIFFIDLLDSLLKEYQLLNNLNDNSKFIDMYNQKVIIGKMNIIGLRFNQEIANFIPDYNQNLISKFSPDKNKLITENELILIENNLKYKEIGYVSNVSNDLTLKIRKNCSNNNENNLNNQNNYNIIYNIQKLMNIIVYEKTLNSFKLFWINDNEYLNNNLRKIIIGSYENPNKKEEILKLCYEQVFKISDNYKPQNSKLNPSQISAIKTALSNRLTIIQGPPGTGKTTVAVEIVLEYIKINKKLKTLNSNTKVLVCAESNCAVDLLFDKLNSNLTISPYRYTYRDNYQDNDFSLSYRSIREKFDKSEVILCTNVGSANEYLKNSKFSMVIIEESSQSTELSTVIPLIHHCNQLILIGDHKQLPPTIISKTSLKNGLSLSLFERLINFGVKINLLNTQYRMHKSLYEFPCANFYDNLILNEGENNNIEIINEINWPNTNYYLGFINVLGKEEIEAQTNSFFNQLEINQVINLIENIMNFPKNLSIGIITPYDAQKRNIIKNLQKTYNEINYDSLTIDTIDGFQGMERDLIIISLVRSNDDGKIGFVNDPRRINVMLTRAKRGLIVIGNKNCMEKNVIWKRWINFVEKNNLVFK